MQFIYAIFRGFGFVTYADSDGVDKVIEFGSHELDGKKVSRDLFDCLELLTKNLRRLILKLHFRSGQIQR